MALLIWMDLDEQQYKSKPYGGSNWGGQRRGSDGNPCSHCGTIHLPDECPNSEDLEATTEDPSDDFEQVLQSVADALALHSAILVKLDKKMDSITRYFQPYLRRQNAENPIVGAEDDLKASSTTVGKRTWDK